MSVIEPPPGQQAAKRPKACTSSNHRLPKHSGKDAVLLCGRCQRWVRCYGHYDYAGCIAYPVRWWQLGLKGRIKRYLERGDQDGEAEE